MVLVKLTTLLTVAIFFLGFNVYTAHGLNPLPLLKGLLGKPAAKLVKMTAHRGPKPPIGIHPKPIPPNSFHVSGGRMPASRMGTQGTHNGDIELTPSRWSKHAQKFKGVTKGDGGSRRPKNNDLRGTRDHESTGLLGGNRKGTKHDSEDRQDENFTGAEDQELASHDSTGVLRGGHKGAKHNKSSAHDSKGDRDDGPEDGSEEPSELL